MLFYLFKDILSSPDAFWKMQRGDDTPSTDLRATAEILLVQFFLFYANALC